MDIRSIDLNLLVLFDTLMSTRSVNRTAELIGLSQSATSGALARLRASFDDALFVRTAATMEPTPRALQLGPVVRRVVQTIQSEILAPQQFEPAQAQRSFTILTPDIGEVAFLPGVLRRLQHEAPGVRLQAVSRPRSAASDALEKGEADLAVGFFPDLQKAGYFQQALFTSTYACITSADNEWTGKRLTLKQYLAARHVLVRPDGREHLLDSWLDAKGWRRQVTLELSHFMSLIALLPGTNLVATVPQDIATAVGRHIALQQLELPFKPPQLQVQQFWHRRVHTDPANRWLRALFHEVNRREPGTVLPA